MDSPARPQGETISPSHSFSGEYSRSMSDLDVGIKYSIQHRMRGRIIILKQQPILLVIFFVIFAALATVSILGIILFISARDEKEVNGLMDLTKQAITEIEFTLDSAGGGALALALYTSTKLADTTSSRPLPERIETGFVTASQTVIASWSSSLAVYLDPNGVVTYAYPTVFLGQLQPGFNFLTHFPNVSFSNAIREPLFFTGPFTDSSGRNFVNAFVPIWADAATSDTDFGYGVLECAECWDPMLGRKLFGSTRSLVSLDILLAKSPLFSLVNDGLRFTVQGRQLPPGDINSLSNPIIFSSDKENYCKYDERRLHVENFPINVRNLKWELCAYTQEFSPAWFPLAVSGSIIISMFLAVLITALIVERSHGNAILREILPSKVIDHLKQGAGPYSEKYEKVTILFCDIVGFTPLSSMLDPAQIVNMLDDLYTKYDKLTEKHGVYKVETIGDAYMCVCGCPNRRNPSVAALRMVGLARDIIKTASTFRKSYFPPGYKFQVRVGLHSGDVVAGVVGMKMPRFCLFGDAVNTASRMESNSKPMRIQVSMTTAKLLRKRKPKDIVEFARYHTLYQTDDYYLASRGKLMIKGKGEMKTFFVVNRSDTDQEGVDDHSDTASDVTVKDFFDENASDTASSAGDDDGAPFFHAPTCKAPKFLATLPRLESNRSFNGEENVEDTIIELELSRTALSGPPSRMTTPIVSTQSHPTISVASISKEASVSEKHKESYIMKAVAQFLRKDSEVVKASEYEKIAIDSGCSIEL